MAVGGSCYDPTVCGDGNMRPIVEYIKAQSDGGPILFSWSKYIRSSSSFEINSIPFSLDSRNVAAMMSSNSEK